MLKREGWQVGRNVVYRLYHEEGLVLRTKQPRRRKMIVHRNALQTGPTERGVEPRLCPRPVEQWAEVPDADYG